MKKLKIGIDAHFLSKVAQGTGTYTYQLISALSEAFDDETLYLLNTEDITSNWNNENIKLALLRSNFSPYNVICGFERVANKYSLDILHTNYFCPVWSHSTKSVVTVHDILYKTHKCFFPFKLHAGTELLQKFCLKRADRIIAVSHYTKQKLLEYFPQTTNKIDVIYEAASSDFHVVNGLEDLYKQELSQLGINKPYILYVGRFAPIKNIEKLINIFIEENLSQKYNLVLVGNFDKSFPNKNLETLISQHHGIIHLRGISNSILNVLYNFATLFYFVSNGEGFGLPILEAMSAGCPVITSNTTACNEISGNAAIKVNPSSIEEIAEGINAILTNDSLRVELISKGIKRAAYFSWEKCAEETLHVYHNLCK